MARIKKINIDDPRTIRQKVGETQSTFWSRFGVRQSGGCRYEGGQNIPTPTALLMALYVQGTVSDADLAKARAAIGQ